MMTTEKQLHTIVDSAFAKHFPQWEQMSPLDPVKALAESVGESLIAASTRQQELFDSVLECLPALFSVTPKPGALPIGLFRLRSAARVNEPIEFRKETTFRFQSGVDTLVLRPIDEFTVSAIGNFRCTGTESERVIQFSQRGASADFVVAFLPDKTGASAEVVDLQLTTARGTLSLASLDIVDTTEAFSQFGTLKFSRRDGQPLFSSSGEISIRLSFSDTVRGQFAVNVFPFEMGQKVESLSLGSLRGQAWEEIPLPNSLPEAPKEIVISFPDGRQKNLTRLEDEALYVRHADPAGFQGRFLYHGVRHALIVPTADQLLGRYHGGVTVSLPTGLAFPAFDEIPDGFQPILAEHLAVIDELSPFSALRPAVPRETAESYLARFYRTLRQFHALPARQTKLDLKEIEMDLRHAEKQVRAIEAVADDKTQMITVYAMATAPSEHAFRIDTELASRLRNRLAQIVPAIYNFQLKPFQPVSIGVTCRLTLQLADSRLTELGEDVVAAQVAQCCDQILLPPPFGNFHYSLSWDATTFAEAVSRRLTEELLRPEELGSLSVTFKDDQGNYAGRIRRPAGTCYRVQTKTALSIQLMREVIGA